MVPDTSRNMKILGVSIRGLRINGQKSFPPETIIGNKVITGYQILPFISNLNKAINLAGRRANTMLTSRTLRIQDRPVHQGKVGDLYLDPVPFSHVGILG